MISMGGAAVAARSTIRTDNLSQAATRYMIVPADHDGGADNEAAYLTRRYDEEMQAGANAQSTQVKIAHFELAYRYALRARDMRASVQL